MAVRCDVCPLRTLDAFLPFTAEEMRFMRRFKVGELTVEPDTVLLTEGSNASQLFTVLSGQGLRTKRVTATRRQVLNFVFPGDFLGLQAGIMGKMGHSVEATTQMTLCVFDRQKVWDLFSSYPDRAFDMTWLSASEEMFLGEALAAIGQRPALEAVAWSILRLIRRGESLGLVENGRMPFPFRQQDLADALGLSLVHTNKTLAKLRDFAVWQEGTLTVTDPAGLASLVGSVPDTPQPRPLI